MPKLKIFITGGAGFLGSAILSRLIDSDLEILAAKRSTTQMLRCKNFLDRVQWVNTDEDYIQSVVLFQPDIIIHSAWSGVTAKERVDWVKQLQNFVFFKDLINIAEQSAVKKFIVLGSQAEYGNIDFKVSEDSPASGNDAYAACKRSMQKLLEAFCNQHNQNWFWLRVFSVYGPGEDRTWFIPWIISNQLKGKDTDLTACEQQYDYLFIDDFATMIEKVVVTTGAQSGIYNICSGHPIPLKLVAETIQKEVGSGAKLNFGVLPYRLNQSMYIGGDNNKYHSAFGNIAGLGLHKGVSRTINYYRNDLNKDGEVL